jgi:toxin ParE1/3/4
MRLTFYRRAARQVDEIFHDIASDKPSAAQKVVDRIYEVAQRAAANPGSGRSTTAPGIRMFVVNPYPYLLYFRRRGDEVCVLRVVHTARRRQFELKDEARPFSPAL